jgi:hypothetical protein
VVPSTLLLLLLLLLQDKVDEVVFRKTKDGVDVVEGAVVVGVAGAADSSKDIRWSKGVQEVCWHSP